MIKKMRDPTTVSTTISDKLYAITPTGIVIVHLDPSLGIAHAQKATYR